MVIYNAESTKWISIAGNIGSGKSTLSELIGSELQSDINGKTVPFQLLQEEWKTNPYFNEYYEAINRFYGELDNGSFLNGNGSGRKPNPVFFNSQYWWLTKKGNQNSGIPSLLETVNVSQDRSVPEDGLFEENLKRLGLISERNDRIYKVAYEGLSYYPQPDMMIYLRTSPKVCKERIIKRGRLAERKIPIRYLESLNELYEEWWARFEHPNKLMIETDGLNLADSINDQEEVLRKIAYNLADRPRVRIMRWD